MLGAEAYLYKMAPVARIQIAPPLKYLKLCIISFGFGFMDIIFLIYTYVKFNRKVSILKCWYPNEPNQPNYAKPNGAHGTCPACHTLDTPLVRWVPCHSGIVRPQVADGRDGLQIWRVKGRNYPCNRPWRPIWLWDVEAPMFYLDNRLTGGGEVVSLMRRPPFTPRNIPGTHFC
jgi:hypothetical protein